MASKATFALNSSENLLLPTLNTLSQYSGFPLYHIVPLLGSTIKYMKPDFEKAKNPSKMIIISIWMYKILS